MTPPADPLEELIVELLIAATRRRSDDDELLTVNRLWRTADQAPAAALVGVGSIWQWADQMAAPKLLAEQQGDLFAEPDPITPAISHRRRIDKVRRDGGRMVVQGLAYPSGRWTDERAEAERARRARQVVPKPVAAARVFKIGRGV